MSVPMRWDPAQYDRYSDERSRPFFELIARVRVDDPHRVVDIGCGPGALTRALFDRWPNARVTGVDSSADMIETAKPLEVPGRLEFVRADLREWHPDTTVDVVVANAVLQWVPGHRDRIADLAAWLRPGGALAFQVPDNFDEPSHQILRDLRLSARWRDRLGPDADRGAGVERPHTYFDVLADSGLAADVWQTTYLHVLHGDDAVLEWIKGTALRPVLDALAGDEAATNAFLAECGAELRVAYPQTPHGTLFPFRRTFAVGHLPT
jgi:trans-aconitate 2-methyltransferase